MCPIMMELMVDPVMAMDLNTYERSNILRHFEVEQGRIAATQEPNASQEACLCGHVQVRHAVNSPLTGSPLPTEMLLPNKQVIQMIQEAVDTGYFGDGEVCDWRARRDEARLDQQEDAVLLQPPPPLRPSSNVKEGFLIMQTPQGNPSRRYIVLFRDRLIWYADDSKNEVLGLFRFRPLTKLVEQAASESTPQVVLRTPSFDSQGSSRNAEEELVLWAEEQMTTDGQTAAGGGVEAWREVICEQLQQNSTSYVPRAEDVRIVGDWVAVGLCSQADLEAGRERFRDNYGQLANRGKCEGCGQVQLEGVPQQCKRCARVLCNACVQHSAYSFERFVLETESATKAQCNASICAECFEDMGPGTGLVALGKLVFSCV